MPNIAVFGGSQLKPGEDGYIFAYKLGKMLGEHGFSVITGGYIGSMEAVSKGASEAGVNVIGVTCEDIEKWRQVGANSWVKVEIRMKSIPERILYMIENSDGAMALPGGVGTLTEIMMMWNLLLTESIRPRPLILIGDGWEGFIRYYVQEFEAYIPEDQRNWISTVNDLQTAVQQLHETLSNGKV